MQVIARHQNYNRQLSSRIDAIEFAEWRQKVVNERTALLLHAEHTLLTQRKTKDLDELIIPEWRSSDLCTCDANQRTCPKHWRQYEVKKQAKIKGHHKFELKSKSEEELYESFPITRHPTPRRKTLPMKRVSYVS